MTFLSEKVGHSFVKSKHFFGPGKGIKPIPVLNILILTSLFAVKVMTRNSLSPLRLVN